MPQPNPKIAVGGLIIENDRILLIRRGHPPQVNFWAIPGGHVEVGELLKTAIQREIKEELGVEVDVGALVYFTELKDDTHHFIIFDFACFLASSESRLASYDDAREYGFFTRQEALELPLASGMRAFIEDMVRRGLMV